jgi:mono/diheme cytochrome c family protein
MYVTRMSLAVLTVLAAACSRPDSGAAAGSASGAARNAPSAMMQGGMLQGGVGSAPKMMGAATADTSAAPAAVAPRADSAADCPPVTQQLADKGRVVFSSQGNCFACHAANAHGTPLAPNLTDAQWIDIDGSYASIAGLVRTGVPKPKQHPAPMPPLGGATLSGSQVCAVAAYVYSLSHR